MRKHGRKPQEERLVLVVPDEALDRLHGRPADLESRSTRNTREAAKAFLQTLGVWPGGSLVKAGKGIGALPVLTALEGAIALFFEESRQRNEILDGTESMTLASLSPQLVDPGVPLDRMQSGQQAR